MKVRIVVDANIIISALLGGRPRFLLFEPRFEFITTQFTLKEVSKYMPLISKKSGVSEQEIKQGISFLPLRVVDKNYYESHIEMSKMLMEKIDKDDVDILALYLEENTFLWSEDKDFEKVDLDINLLRTEDFMMRTL